MPTSIKFALIADPQLGISSSFNKNISNNDWSKDLENLNKCIENINFMRRQNSQITENETTSQNHFKFTMFLGDLVHAFPFSENHDEQVLDFKKAIENIDTSDVTSTTCTKMDLRLIPGNHDLGQIPTEAAIKMYKENYNCEDYYDFIEGDFHFICVNSQPFKVDLEQEENSLTEQTKQTTLKELTKQSKWLEKTLSNKTNQDKHKIVFMHIPPFTKTINEPTTWNNLPLKNRKYLCGLFSKFKVEYIFTGHCHKNLEVLEFSENSAENSENHANHKTKIIPLGSSSFNADIFCEDGKWSILEDKEDKLGWFIVELKVDGDGKVSIEKKLQTI